MTESVSAPLVSVLMTSYNRAEFIGAAIESVLTSTYTAFELIISDDCSKDDTVNIARSYASIDERVKVFVNETNLGDYPNRNKAASYAKGAYLKYVDADDLIYPWGLELMVSMMKSFPDAAWGLCSLEQDRSRIFPFVLSPIEAYKYHYDGPGLFHKAPLSSIIRTEAFKQVGGFSNLRMVGDFEMWHRLAQKYPVVLMPHGMVWYRVHGGQEMQSYKQFLGDYEKIKIHFLTSTECPLSVEESKIVLNNERRVIQRELLKSLIRLDFNQIPSVYKKLKAHK